MEKLENMIEQFESLPNNRKKIDLAIRIVEKLFREYASKDEVEKYIKFALDQSLKQEYQLGMGHAYRQYAQLHFNDLSLDKALDCGFKSLNTFKVLGNDEGLSFALSDIGLYYTALGMDKKGLDYFLQSIKYKPDNMIALNNAGERYVQWGDSEKAIPYFTKVIELSQKKNVKKVEATALKNLGELYNRQGETDKAIEYFQQSLTIGRQIKDVYVETFAQIGLAMSYMIVDDLDIALNYNLQALNNVESINSLELRWFCYKNLAQLYEQNQDYQQSNFYLKKNMELHELMYTEKITQRIAELDSAYGLEKKEMEAKQMIEKSARLASIGVMAAGITHEINQPLNAISINANSIIIQNRKDHVLPPNYEKAIRQITDGVSRINEIIKHMRSFWASPELIANQLIDVNETTKYALGLIKRQLKAHGIKLITDFNSLRPVAQGNQVHFEQVILNLVTNSIHSLDMISHKEKNIMIQTDVVDDNVYLRVRDNGIGLSEDIGDKLYDPFYSSGKSEKGMGLGLAIVKHYIDEMQGSISHKNIESGGVEFEVMVPRVNKEK